MVIKDFEYKYKEWEDGKPYLEMWSNIIIKRHGKLWKVICRTGYDLSGVEKEFEIVLEAHRRHQRRTYYMWRVDIDKDPKDMINTIPFEFEDEEMTKEEYTEKFGEKLY